MRVFQSARWARFSLRGKETAMFKKERLPGAGIVLGLAMLGISPVGVAQARADTGNDSQVEAEVHKALDNKKFQDVKASVHDGNVLLTGQVERYADKEDADRRVHHVGNVKAVDNEIQVASSGSATSDDALRDKLAKELA